MVNGAISRSNLSILRRTLKTPRPVLLPLLRFEDTLIQITSQKQVHGPKGKVKSALLRRFKQSRVETFPNSPVLLADLRPRVVAS